MPGLAPCGECRELVPRDAGCEHWRPVGTRPMTANERAARYRERKRLGLGPARRAAPEPAVRQVAELAWLRRVTVAREVG